jgi:hypothetical protein
VDGIGRRTPLHRIPGPEDHFLRRVPTGDRDHLIDRAGEITHADFEGPAYQRPVFLGLDQVDGGASMLGRWSLLLVVHDRNAD